MVAAPARQQLFARLRELAADSPIVVAHRGDSRHHPENTLPAFAAAVALRAPMQEFDVQVTADGQLVCLHDPTLDRTSDAAARLGPGALLTGLTLQELQRLDAGNWKGTAHLGARVPTLEQALAVMLPTSIPMIEQKAGDAQIFARELQRLAAVERVLVQSFDWQFVADVGRTCPGVALGLLGPTPDHQHFDERTLDAAHSLGAGLIHWHAPEITAAGVDAAHSRGLLVCTYTSDDELAWHGGRAIGVDAMCTNDPARMMAALARVAHK